MSHQFDMLSTLRRPRLLVTAARYKLASYRRDRDLPRLLKIAFPGRQGRCLGRLLRAESEINHARLTGCATYSIARHIELLAALMDESTARTAASDADHPDQPKASGSLSLR